MNILLFILAISGFLPLAIILYKRRRVKRILNSGIKTNALIYHTARGYKSTYDIVHYTYLDNRTGKQYNGTLSTQTGQYKNGDYIEIHFLPENPSRSSMPGAWSSLVFIVFGIVLAAFILFAVYKIKEYNDTGSI